MATLLESRTLNLEHRTLKLDHDGQTPGWIPQSLGLAVVEACYSSNSFCGPIRVEVKEKAHGRSPAGEGPSLRLSQKLLYFCAPPRYVMSSGKHLLA